MDDGKKIAQAALASLMALQCLTPAVAADAPAANGNVKCYGVAAAGKNDCGTVISACAASIKEEGACYAWVYLPKNICEKLAHSCVNEPAPGCKNPAKP